MGSKAPPGYLRFSGSCCAPRYDSAPAIATNSCGTRGSNAIFSEGEQPDITQQDEYIQAVEAHSSMARLSI